MDNKQIKQRMIARYLKEKPQDAAAKAVFFLLSNPHSKVIVTTMNLLDECVKHIETRPGLRNLFMKYTYKLAVEEHRDTWFLLFKHLNGPEFHELNGFSAAKLAFVFEEEGDASNFVRAVFPHAEIIFI